MIVGAGGVWGGGGGVERESFSCFFVRFASTVRQVSVKLKRRKKQKQTANNPIVCQRCSSIAFRFARVVRKNNYCFPVHRVSTKLFGKKSASPHHHRYIIDRYSTQRANIISRCDSSGFLCMII